MVYDFIWDSVLLEWWKTRKEYFIFCAEVVIVFIYFSASYTEDGVVSLSVVVGHSLKKEGLQVG